MGEYFTNGSSVNHADSDEVVEVDEWNVEFEKVSTVKICTSRA